MLEGLGGGPPKWCGPLLVAYVVISVALICALTWRQEAPVYPSELSTGKVTNVYGPKRHLSTGEVQDLIVALAPSYGVKAETALRIASCESSFRWDAQNPASTAKGVYQWTDGSWTHVGACGHQFDEEENIRQFLLHYPSHPNWWECQ